MIPPLFLCHGAPTLILEDIPYARFLIELGASLQPKGIILFSAHWEAEFTTLSRRDSQYSMIYDFGGFDPVLRQYVHPARGSIALADQALAALKAQGIPCQGDEKRGLDHGAWNVLALLDPEGKIPVVQASVNPFHPMEEQLAIGRALSGLALEDILILGSGSTVHNLSAIQWGATAPADWAMAFDDWMEERILAGNEEELCRYRELAPYARQAVPREEHLAPLFLAMGAGGGVPGEVLHRSYGYGTLTYAAYQFPGEGKRKD